jgi:hypothetical protein
MSNPETPNATTHSPDNARSHGAAGDLSRGDPDKKERFNGLSGGGQDGGGAYPNPHTGKEGGGNKEGFMGHGGQTEMAYHGTGQLGEDKTGGNANSPTAKTKPGENKDEEQGA